MVFMSENDQKNLIPAADRILRLIEILMTEPDGFLPTDLLERLEISRSTLFSWLKLLKEQGYIEQAERRGRYRLGPKLQSWRSAPSPGSRDLLAVFYQESGHISFDETLGFVLLSSEGPYLLAQIEGNQPVRCVFSVGMVFPDLTGARQLFTPYPHRSVVRDGYCIQPRGDVIDLAVPVCQDGVRPIAALVLSVPAFRWKPEALIAAFHQPLRSLAARISYRLGAQFYSPYVSRLPIMTDLERMSKQEIDRFLQGPWTARLACVRPDGFPHIITLWQEWDGEAFIVLAWKGSQWSKYILQNASVSMTVDEPFPPFRRVVVDGKAVALPFTQQDKALIQLIRKMAKRYLGQFSEGLTTQVDGVFRIIPDQVKGMHGLPDLFGLQPDELSQPHPDINRIEEFHGRGEVDEFTH